VVSDSRKPSDVAEANPERRIWFREGKRVAKREMVRVKGY